MTKIQQLPSDYARTKISEIYKDKNEKFINNPSKLSKEHKLLALGETIIFDFWKPKENMFHEYKSEWPEGYWETLLEIFDELSKAYGYNKKELKDVHTDYPDEIYQHTEQIILNRLKSLSLISEEIN
ncbi:hypothetical protein KBD45_01620 [Candidatus Dojkabacteria bacterium]|nr:hypothetical protein [Candidatus Dojkabacteria bacterium]